MSQIAFVWNDLNIYWSAIVITVGILAGVLAAVGLRLLQGKCADLLIFLPFAVVFGFFAGRFQHWYCFYRQYESLSQALTDYSVGGFCLTGTIAGVLLAALLLRLLKIIPELGSFLDALAPAGALAIAVGRMSAVFYSGDRGKVLFQNESLQGLPFSTAMVDSLGDVSWRAAVFFWEAVAALLIFLVLLVVFLRERKAASEQNGKVFQLFLVLYGGVEIVLDSMRYDSAFFRSNGFVSLLQVVSLIAMVAVLVTASVRAIRQNGMRPRFIGCWIAFLAAAGVMGYMEYYVQRHGDLYVMCYSVMSAGLCVCWAAELLLMKAGTSRAQPSVSETTE